MAMYSSGWTYGSAERGAWERWKKGEGLKSIGRAFGKPSSCIFAHLRPSGGVMPPARRRSRLALTMAEREEISRGIVEGQSVRAIARMLARAASTVSREINRNGGIGRYRAAAADKLAWKQALRPKPCKLAMHGPLRQAVVGKLELNWSPEQIAGWLKRASPETEAWRVSHETIYRSLYVQARGVLKKELLEHLRSRRPIRRSRHATAKADQRGRIPDAVSISERPASVEDRAVPGHWEGDLLCGSKNSYIVTFGRTPLALRDASQGREQGNANRRRCIDPASKEAARRTLQIPDLGSRQGTRRPQAVQHENRYRRLLL